MTLKRGSEYSTLVCTAVHPDPPVTVASTPLDPLVSLHLPPSLSALAKLLSRIMLAGVSKLLASLGHSGWRRVVLGHTLNTQTLRKNEEPKKNPLCKFMILCWVTFIAILGLMWPTGHGLDILRGKPQLPEIFRYLFNHLFFLTLPITC